MSNSSNEETIEDRIIKALGPIDTVREAESENDSPLRKLRRNVKYSLDAYIEFREQQAHKIEALPEDFRQMKTLASAVLGSLRDLAKLDRSIVPLLHELIKEFSILMTGTSHYTVEAEPKIDKATLLGDIKRYLATSDDSSVDDTLDILKASALGVVVNYERLLDSDKACAEVLRTTENQEMMFALLQVYQLDPKFGTLYHQAEEHFTVVEPMQKISV